LDALTQHPDGAQVLEILEEILSTIRSHPDNEKYRCVNLRKSRGHKLLAALPFLQVFGCQEGTVNDVPCLQVPRMDTDVLERVLAMVYWARASTTAVVQDLRPASQLLEHALGAALGAAIGDALGAPLAKLGPGAVTRQEVEKALEMCGGGFFGVAKGQTTGWTELAICAAEGLAEARAGGRSAAQVLQSPPLEDSATRYGKWGQSFPKWADKASREAFQRPMPLASLVERAKEFHQKSLSSGPLLRCVPSAVLAAAASSPVAAASLATSRARSTSSAVTR